MNSAREAVDEIVALKVFAESFLKKFSMAQQKLDFFFTKSASKAKRRIEEDNSGDRNTSTEGDSAVDDNRILVREDHDVESQDGRGAGNEGTTSASSQAKNKKQKRADGFKTAWNEKRPWLEFVPGSGMFCKMCKKYDKTPFGKGKWNTEPCVRIRLESVKDHEETVEHKDSVVADLASEVTAHVGQLLTKPKDMSQDAMVKAFQSLYFLCKNGIAHTTNFPKLLDLLSFLGLNIKERINKGNANYTSTAAIKEMIVCMSEVIENEILEDMRKSTHYALMFDETTDVTTVEQMVIHARFLDDEGNVRVHFLKIIDCLEKSPEADAAVEPVEGIADVNDVDENVDGPADAVDEIVDNVVQHLIYMDNDLDDTIIRLNAKQITTKVTDYIEKNDLDYSKLKGIGTDGAAVMVGRKNGAVKQIIERQLQQQTESASSTTCQAIGQHCAAHKLNLAASKAGNAFEVVKKTKRILRKLHDFYSRSAVRTKGLLAVQKLRNSETESDTLDAAGKVQNPSETRWLALGKCVVALKKILPSLIISLQRESDERGDVQEGSTSS